MAGRTQRFALVDSMRALAAISVVVFHVTYKFPVPQGGAWSYLSQRNAGPPITGVVVFFLISGFVLYRPFVKARFEGEPMPPLVPYAVRRVARIVPAYWVALAVVTVWLGLKEVMHPGGVVRYFGFLQLYGNSHTAGGGISVAWTLGVEVTFYATLPLLALAMRRWGRSRSFVGSELAMCGTLVLASLAWQAVIIATVSGTSGWLVTALWTLPGSLDLFGAGMALAVLSVVSESSARQPRWIRVVERRPWLPWLLAAGVFYAVGRSAELYTHGFAAWWIPSHELKALGAALLLLPVIFGAPDRGWLRRALGWRPLLWLGTVSYGIYLWHKPVLDGLDSRLVPHGEVITALVLLAVTVAIAAASFYLIERPAQRVARRLVAARAARAESSLELAVPGLVAATLPSVDVETAEA
jgi:peptidoglycan/LPS O-acetylase OafA/YrhL